MEGVRAAICPSDVSSLALFSTFAFQSNDPLTSDPTVFHNRSGGRDLSGNKRTNKEQSKEQVFEKMNKALKVSCREGYPVRVVR